MADFKDLFTRFSEIVRPAQAKPTVEVAPPSEDELLAKRMAPWASQSAIKAEFVPWLEQEMDRARLTANARISDHGSVAYAIGFEAALRYVRDNLMKWQS